MIYSKVGIGELLLNISIPVLILLPSIIPLSIIPPTTEPILYKDSKSAIEKKL